MCASDILNSENILRGLWKQCMRMIFLYINSKWTFRDNVGEKATNRKRYNRIPHPALDTKWEMNTYNLDGIK